MITLNPQTEHKLQEIASQTGQSVQQFIESLLADYQTEQECIKRADQAYADYLKSGESISLAQIRQNNDLAN